MSVYKSRDKYVVSWPAFGLGLSVTKVAGELTAVVRYFEERGCTVAWFGCYDGVYDCRPFVQLLHDAAVERLFERGGDALAEMSRVAGLDANRRVEKFVYQDAARPGPWNEKWCWSNDSDPYLKFGPTSPYDFRAWFTDGSYADAPLDATLAVPPAKTLARVFPGTASDFRGPGHAMTWWADYRRIDAVRVFSSTAKANAAGFPTEWIEIVRKDA